MASQTNREHARNAAGTRDFAARQAELFSADFSFSGYERDLLALNLGDGRYLNISGVSGADSVTDGRGAAFADFDNDGDTDIFVRAMHGQAHLLLRNRVGQDNGFVRIALQGVKSGRDSFGAVVRVKTSAGVLTQTKSGGSGFLSQSDPRLLFGLGDDARAQWIEVTWPSGLVQRFDGPVAGASLILVEGESELRSVQERRFKLPDPLLPIEQRFQAVRVKPKQRLPDLSLLTTGGQRVPLGDTMTPGRPVLVSFWATWCQPCAAEMPELQRLHTRSGSQGLRVVGISLDEADTRGEIPGFLGRLGITYPIYVIERSELARLFTTSDVGIPLSILLDGDGRVVDLFEGWSAQTRRRLDKLMSAMQTK